MADPWPQVGIETYKDISLTALAEVSIYYRDFAETLREVPDERGLTDLFILKLAHKHARFYGTRTTGRVEGREGHDYIFQCTIKRPTNGQVERVRMYIQAKTFKPDNNGILVADFTYRNKQGVLQMNLLQQTVAQERINDPTIRFFAGYLIYCTEHEFNLFVPVDDVIAAYTILPNNPGPGVVANRALSQLFVQDKLKYPIFDLLQDAM
ncbi:hypothetical protein FB45DRAFT_1033928 [Roridomyces roridus]|uniref:Uncharacterized protein n=1 Tax=Roridomyces roridus TaxID=1738132 RepID=A0AAD7BF22_9AGAR|nr:hypothetical protein FB45DRAFT_1033928 [Roridomyces roridus]